MSKIVTEEFVCDEHEEDHEAPLYAVVQFINRKTGKLMGAYGIDVCEKVRDWYVSNGVKITPSSKEAHGRSIFLSGNTKEQVTKSVSRPSRSKPIPRKRSTKNASSSVIREWANSQGLPVSQRGRISKEVRDAYRKAH